MFIKASTIALALVAFVNAVPHELAARTGSACDTGSLQCCTQLLNSSSSGANSILGLLGLAGTVEGIFGLECNPITAIGTGSGASCTEQPACCDNVTQNSLIGINCSPFNLGL